MRPKYYINILLFCLLGLATSPHIDAQQDALFDQHIFNPQFYNAGRVGGPGFFGINYQQQWMDVEDRPTTYFLRGDLSEILKLGEKRIGLAFTLFSDNAQAMLRNHFSATFSYKILNIPGNQLTLGVVAGGIAQRLDAVDRPVNDPFDIVLFENTQSATGFRGGLGLHYQLMPSDQHIFNLDVSLPQLFSSDIKYNEGPITELDPHITAAISYRYRGDVVSIEPILMYRELIGTNKIKEGNLDIALRALFLDERAWFGAGARPSGTMESMNMQVNYFHFDFGIKPIQQVGLEILGSFGMHSIIGNKFEAGLIYHLAQDNRCLQYVDNKKTADQSKKEVKKLWTQYEKEKNADRIYTILSSLRDEAGINSFAFTERYDKAMDLLEAQKRTLELITTQKRKMDNLEAAIQQQAGEENVSECTNRKSIRESKAYIQNIYDAVNSEITIFEDIAHSLEFKRAIKGGDISYLEQYYNGLLDRLSVKPRGMRNASVTFENGRALISYQFPYLQTSYNLEDNDLEGFRNVAALLHSNLSELNSLQVSILSIDLLADLQFSRSNWNLNAGKYDGTFGRQLTVGYSIKGDNDTRQIQSMVLNMNDNINQEQLAVLKLKAFDTYLRKIATVYLPSRNLLVAANPNQPYQQIVKLVIVIDQNY